jgi:hypothetical protein
MSGLAIASILFVIVLMVITVIDGFTSPRAFKVFADVIDAVLKAVNFLISLWVFVLVSCVILACLAWFGLIR